MENGRGGVVGEGKNAGLKEEWGGKIPMNVNVIEGQIMHHVPSIYTLHGPSLRSCFTITEACRY
eukprot:768382-Hanusia_phi.AAC.8